MENDRGFEDIGALFLERHLLSFDPFKYSDEKIGCLRKRTNKKRLLGRFL